ncbi:MAG: GNAT family N-acetyltransferase [Candidatus Limnocylindrales bacterium]
MEQIWQRGDFEISTDPARVDLPTVHRFLNEEAYWSPGVPLDVVRRAIDASIVFGVYRVAGGEQAGFARVVSDKATFAWICDVFILDEFRGHGLGKWLMATIAGHPDLHGLRRWMLATRDAHTLYEKSGFTALHDATRFMEKWDPEIYRR